MATERSPEISAARASAPPPPVTDVVGFVQNGKAVIGRATDRASICISECVDHDDHNAVTIQIGLSHRARRTPSSPSE